MFDFHARQREYELVRSYGQACALAKALDVIGDRWTLLIVRELLIRGACRYTDLRDGLPGIATNLLAERLDDLTEAGVISREAASPPIATTLFRLTERGRQLEPAIEALGRWGAPLLATASAKDAFRSHWLVLPLRMCVRDKSPSARPVRLEVRAGGTIAVETVGDGSVTARLGTLDDPDVMLDGPPQVVLGLLTGKIDLASAQRKGLKYEGDRRIVRRFVGR
jgi:DNA-binding HxlR family transcriptional regulator